MSDLFRLTDAQMARLALYFPKSQGKPRVDDRPVLSGTIIFRHDLRWRDAPTALREGGILARMMAGLAAHEKTTVMIDATYLKVHRTATSMAVEKGSVAA